jgi:signal transduction histidine kinase
MLLAVFMTALGVTFLSKWFADRSAQRATLERLTSTGNLCVNASYPLTSSVLNQIQELSNLKLAIIASDESQSSATALVPRVESTSIDFPSAVKQQTIGSLCLRARSSNKPFYDTIVTETGRSWNASAFRLTSNPSNVSYDRCLILLESADNSNRATIQAFVLPLVTGFCSSIAVALVATFVASRIGRRIERLEKHVQRIADGSFETITPEGPMDAIHSLTVSVNSMSQQLLRSNSQIAQNERSRLINLIASGLAHELRNRLTGARLAIQTCDPEPKMQEALGIAQKQMLLAEETIQRLLTLKGGTPNATTSSMMISQIAAAVLELTQPIADHQRVSFSVESLTSHAQAIPGFNNDTSVKDGNALVGAIINLVLNAFEAAGPGGIVELRTRIVQDREATFLEWFIRDNGPGPSTEIEKSMFEPFATTKREGVGLGLAMSKQIAQRQQGDIRWSRDGKWTEFVLRIRLQHPE